MFSGKVAVVTGSTSGIGLGIATALARQGADIVLNGFGDAAEIERTRARLEAEFGVRVVHDGADLSKGEAVREMIDHAVATMGRIDILVNNAGIQHTASIEEFPVEKWDAILALNLSAVFHATAAALPHMKQQGAGRIINIASVHGLVGSVNKSAYVAAKHGVVGFTKVTALENAGTGITANAICPGWVRTALVEQQITALAEREGTDQESAARALLAEKQPSLQFVTPEQMGEMVVFLASDAAAQITGAALPVDGGWTALAGCARCSIGSATSVASMVNNTSDEPTVPKPRPPFSSGLVSRSPKVAPNGRVSTKAIQNRMTRLMPLMRLASAVNAMRLPISSAPPVKPSPESSARKSPSAVPSVLENSTAVQ